MQSISKILAFVFLGAALHAQETKSFLVNGGFEEGDGPDLPGWSRAFHPKHDGINDCVKRSNARAKSGQWALQIDTQPVLGEEVVAVYNGAVAPEARLLRGRTLVLSGWVHVESGAALRPMGMRLRCFGNDKDGKSVFLADVLGAKVLGKTGEWTPFRFSGVVPDKEITSMDLHCGIRPDTVRTLQFLDDLRLELLVPPLMEVRLLRDAVWSDETALALDVRVNEPAKEATTLAFSLFFPKGKMVEKWNRSPQTGVAGLSLPKAGLDEGRYLLRSELRDAKGAVLASTEPWLEVTTSPWEGAPKKRHKARNGGLAIEAPEGFQVLGAVAPADLPDTLPAQPEMTSADVASPEWDERGYAVFSRHYLDGVSRMGRPRPGELGPMRLLASPGEYEPATISVWAIRLQKGVRVTVSDLVGKKGIIPASHVDVRVVRSVQGLPSFLEKRQSVDIPEGQTQTFWLTLFVASEAPAGFYWGEIEVTPQDGEPTRVDMLLRVLPLQLPPPPRGYGFWWKMDARWDGYYSKDRGTALEQIRKQFSLLREHGCNMVSCYGMPKMTKADAGVSINFEQDHWGHDKFAMADFLRLGRETRFFSPQAPLQYPGADLLHTDWIADAVKLKHGSPAFEDFYRDACQRIDRWAKEQGITLAFACVDEIGNGEEQRQTALRFYRVAHEAGVLTSVTDNSMHTGVHLMAQSRFDDLIAMRLYNFITPEMIEHARHCGDRLWLYNMGSAGWDGKRDRFVFGLFTERCSAEGYSQWAFQWAAGNSNPYEAAAGGKTTGYHYVLPAPDGPLPTVALEGVREGIDDARYLSLLPPKERPAFLSDIEPFSTRIGDYLDGHSAICFDVRRWRMARAIMKKENRQP